MSYQVVLRQAAQKQLDRVTGKDYQAIDEAISGLKQVPRPRGVEKLAESGLWRIRVRRYRLIYNIDDKENLVTVVRVAQRTEDTYRRL